MGVALLSHDHRGLCFRVFPLPYLAAGVIRPRLMASRSTGNSPANGDWVDLLSSSEQLYGTNLQAITSSQSHSESAKVEDQEQSGSGWGLWDLVRKPLSWVTSGDTSSVDRKDNSADCVAGTSNMAASDQKKGPSAFIKKAGGAVKKIFRSDEPEWELVELKVILSSKRGLPIVWCLDSLTHEWRNVFMVPLISWHSNLTDH